jgi:serine/threonine protein kinase
MQSGKTVVADIDVMTFGRYVSVKLLGKGAMGRVYLATDPVLQRPVAVKVIAIEENLDEQTRTSFLERFNLEARASARLGHPSIVTVYDAGEQGGFPWIAFEFIEGESLEDLLLRENQLSNIQMKTILTDIASALQHAHAAGIVHRDVKPANILIEKKTGISKLSDFGVIKAPFSMATQEGLTLGSPGYMSPEQIDGSGVDQRSDLFSLGIIYYQMLTGNHPFLRDTLQSTLYATLMGEYAPLRKYCPDIDHETESLVNKLLKVKKEDRVGSAQDFLIALEKNTAPGVSSGNSNLTGKLMKSGSTLVKTMQPVMQMIKRTDEVIFNTVKSPKVHSFFKKCATCFLLTLVKISVEVKKIPFGKLVKNEKNRKASLISIGILLFILSVYSVYLQFFSLSADEKGVLAELARDGYKGAPSQLITQCIELTSKNELNDAQKIAEALSKIKRQSAHAYLLNAIIELKDDDGDDAVEAIDQAKRQSGFQKAFMMEKRALIDEFKNFLSDDEISREMIDCIVYTLHLGKDSNFKKWPYEKSYWLRWNSIRILNEAGQKVSMMDVYILDLKYAGSMRVRIKAANKLGEMKDKRAISALEEVAQRGFADPIVSVAAQSALDGMKK